MNINHHGASYHEFIKPKPILDPTKVNEIEINRQWSSIPQGSEDFSFLRMRKNIFEDAIFRCEDERYNLDLLIGQSESVY